MPRTRAKTPEPSAFRPLRLADPDLQYVLNPERTQMFEVIDRAPDLLVLTNLVTGYHLRLDEAGSVDWWALEHVQAA